VDELRIATRSSALATAQAEQVAACLRGAHPDLTTRLVPVRTSGDEDRTSPVTSLTEVGAFVRAVQRAVVEGRADLAVHSAKDLPVLGPSELTQFHPVRGPVWDVLCGANLAALPTGARVGTGSPRRAAQLARLRPDVAIVPVRGNVDTRLGLVTRGEVGAVVLAEAGLERLGRNGDFHHRFSLEEMVPAPAQGALAIEALAGSRAARLAEVLVDPATVASVGAERRLLGITGAGCRSALGALGEVEGDHIRLTGFVADEWGPRRAEVLGADPEQAADLLSRALAAGGGTW
jgi:hydroxymethylbilane synthase